MMCNAWSKHKNIPNDAKWGTKKDGEPSGKIESAFPDMMPIEVLSENLNLPNLQQDVDDITQNYLNRQASKRWILYEYPEKIIKKIQESGVKKKLLIPSTLRSMLPNDTITDINRYWGDLYPKYV